MVVADLYDLISAFRKLLGRMGDEARLRLRSDDVSVADKIGWLTDLLEASGSLNLLVVLTEVPDRIHRIATFLAVLEMIRLRLIVALQRAHLGEIWIARREDVGPAGPSEETNGAAPAAREDEA